MSPDECAHEWTGVKIGAGPSEPDEYDEVCAHCGAERTAVEGVDGYSADELREVLDRLVRSDR